MNILILLILLLSQVSAAPVIFRNFASGLGFGGGVGVGSVGTAAILNDRRNNYYYRQPNSYYHSPYSTNAYQSGYNGNYPTSSFPSIA